MVTQDCIFCKIIEKEIPSKFEYESDSIVAINDINPEAPVHILIIPKNHIESMNEVNKSDKYILGEMLSVAKKLAKEKNIAEKGYRLVVNTGKDGGQLIKHLHMHLLGGKNLGSKIVN